MSKHLFEVSNLHVQFTTYGGIVHAVRGASFHVDRGETLAIVGESGCGKSVAVQSVMGLIPIPPGRIVEGEAWLEGQNIIANHIIDGRDIRGNKVGMVFQDPMTSLNPTMTIVNQIAEPLKLHRNLSTPEAKRKAIELLEMSKIPEAAKRAKQYPFEFSGGMLQRAMIAMAIACEPALLIADEPSTALDVTIQAQILDLIKDLQQEVGMGLILITHDLGVVARVADRVVVMYAGEILESGTVDEIFYEPSHPYTAGLLSAMPTNKPDVIQKLMPIPGSPPDLFAPPNGCGYAARCPHTMEACMAHRPQEFNISQSHFSKCWLHHEACDRDVLELKHA